MAARDCWVIAMHPPRPGPLLFWAGDVDWLPDIRHAMRWSISTDRRCDWAAMCLLRLSAAHPSFEMELLRVNLSERVE